MRAARIFTSEGAAMPWSGKSFRQKHNKDLTAKQAAKAAAQANAILASGASEGIAIATANKHARDGGKHKARVTRTKLGRRPT